MTLGAARLSRTPILVASRPRQLPPPAIVPLPAPSPAPSAPALVPALFCSRNLPPRATGPSASLAVVQGTAGPTGVVVIVADPEEAGLARRRGGLATKRAPRFPFIQPWPKETVGEGCVCMERTGRGGGLFTSIAFFRTKKKGAPGSKENNQEPLLVWLAVRHYYFRWQGLPSVDPGCCRGVSPGRPGHWVHVCVPGVVFRETVGAYAMCVRSYAE